MNVEKGKHESREIFELEQIKTPGLKSGEKWMESS